MTAPLAQTSGALPRHRTCASTLLLVRPFAPCWQLLRPRLTSRLRLAPPPFQAHSEISPGKNAILPRTTAGSTPLPLGHKSFAVVCLLALVNVASYPVLVHRLTVSLCTSFPRSVTLTQLCFTSLAVASSREDFHLQDRAHAGRTMRRPAARAFDLTSNEPFQRQRRSRGMRSNPYGFTTARPASGACWWLAMAEIKLAGDQLMMPRNSVFSVAIVPNSNNTFRPHELPRTSAEFLGNYGDQD
jgi:hypothetical protein